MAMIDNVRIGRRFLRSIRIDADLQDPRALEGFICPQTSAEVLRTMARHIAETGQGAFTWTGPYGSGKSSLVVALSTLLSGDANLRQTAAEIFGSDLVSQIGETFQPGSNGWRICPVVGSRADPVDVIGDALTGAGILTRQSGGGWTGGKLVEALAEIAQADRVRYGGVIIFIDEMGKFLEGAAQDGTDIYLFQQARRSSLA